MFKCITSVVLLEKSNWLPKFTGLNVAQSKIPFFLSNCWLNMLKKLHGKVKLFISRFMTATRCALWGIKTYVHCLQKNILPQIEKGTVQWKNTAFVWSCHSASGVVGNEQTHQIIETCLYYHHSFNVPLWTRWWSWNVPIQYVYKQDLQTFFSVLCLQ